MKIRTQFLAYIFAVILASISLSACKKAASLSERYVSSFSQEGLGFYYNPPTLVGSYVYIGSSGNSESSSAQNYFFKLDSSLNKVWEYSLGSEDVAGGAALDSEQNIYFITRETAKTFLLYSLDNDGNLRWSKSFPWFRATSSNSFNGIGLLNPAISKTDQIYVAIGTQFYAYDLSGNELWSYSIQSEDGTYGHVKSAPIIDEEGHVYFNTSLGAISLDSEGLERWVASIPGESNSGPAFSTDQSKIFSAIGLSIYCIETSTGAVVWEFMPSGIPASADFRGTPAIDKDDNVYIGSHDDEPAVFYAIKADGSDLLWQKEMGGDLYSSPALGNDGLIYVGSEATDQTSERLHALDIRTGETLWTSYLSNDPTWSSAAISGEGILYIATMAWKGSDGKVYSFQTDSTGLSPEAGSPRFHGSNENTGR